jgi:DNA-binding NtrC family response regulator
MFTVPRAKLPSLGNEPATVVLERSGEIAETQATFELEVTVGPDTGQRFVVDPTGPARVYAGTSPVCPIRLTDPTVSRRHLALEPVGNRLRASDLGSTNGSTVNGVAFGEVWLNGGERLTVGDSVLGVKRVSLRTVTLGAAEGFGRVLGTSPEMRRIYPLCARIAASDIPAVIEGETGPGKELLAEALHEASPRAHGPFVVLDCTTIPGTLMESVLFGHEKGAFTGAVRLQEGLLEQAHGGTLLIDEIGDLEPRLQPKLLRAIERAEFRRVGGSQWIKVNVRILAATRRDLDQEVQAGRFRDDLFFRLAVARVELPPLRERRGDIAFLVNQFWERLGGTLPVPYDLIVKWERMPWLGNVRELHNAVARQLALGDLEEEMARLRSPAPPAFPSLPARSSALPVDATDVIQRVLELNLPLGRSRELVVDDFERRYVARVLEREGGDVGKAAAASGIARRYFQLLRARRAKAEAAGKTESAG